MHFCAIRGFNFGLICRVKYGTFFTIARPFLDTNFFFMIFLVLVSFFIMKLNNFLVGSFLIKTGLVIGFQLQSAIIQNLESFLNTNTL